MNILSIDTTADICSIALKTSDESHRFHESRPREHAKILLPEIENLLKQGKTTANALDLIVFGRGPGSFTGVRIATGVAQGLAFAGECQVLPISTLQSLAFSARAASGSTVWAALDARMFEIYFAVYEIDDMGIPVLQGDEQVLSPQKLPDNPPKDCCFVGNGWTAGYELPERVNEAVSEQTITCNLPDASDSLALAEILLSEERSQPVAAEQAMPVYLRDKVTWDNKPKVGS